MYCEAVNQPVWLAVTIVLNVIKTILPDLHQSRCWDNFFQSAIFVQYECRLYIKGVNRLLHTRSQGVLLDKYVLDKERQRTVLCRCAVGWSSTVH